MDAVKTQNSGAIRRDPNAKIKVEFDRAPLSQRLKAKYLSLFFLKKVVWYLFRLILLIGISYIVLNPFITKIAGSFMSPEDFVDVTVLIIPKNFTLDTYSAIFTELNYSEAFFNTFMLSISCAVLQTFACALVAYGLAKFKFKGAKVIFILVMLTMIVPHQTLYKSMFTFFAKFDLRDPISTVLGGKGIFELLGGLFNSENTSGGIILINTYMPLLVLSIFGLAFKNGLYIFLLRQFFRGVPDELEESAYIDGSGTFKTFFRIILPLSVPMLITVFLFAFSWQWTDKFYTNMFFRTDQTKLMKSLIESIPPTLKAKSEAQEVIAGQNIYFSAIRNTIGIMIIAPLVVVYVFCQKYLVQGIERSGLTAD
jgi:multiple sugar transport system permease protein